MPLDATPTESGNIALLDGLAVVMRERAEGELLYTSHFATCPQAKRFRKKGATKDRDQEGVRGRRGDDCGGRKKS